MQIKVASVFKLGERFHGEVRMFFFFVFFACTCFWNSGGCFSVFFSIFNKTQCQMWKLMLKRSQLALFCLAMTAVSYIFCLDSNKIIERTIIKGCTTNWKKYVLLGWWVCLKWQRIYPFLGLFFCNLLSPTYICDDIFVLYNINIWEQSSLCFRVYDTIVQLINC